MAWFKDAVLAWAPPAVFLACGLVCLARAHMPAAERTSWRLIGAGLLLYAGGCVTSNLELTAEPALPELLWLSLYPLSLAGMVGLVRTRHVRISESLWLDAVIGGAALAAAAAVFLLPSVADLSLAAGWAGVAGLAYPLCDFLLAGFAVVLWGSGRWRLDSWLAIGAGFALIAVSDTLYVVAQAGDGWVPGMSADLPCAGGAILLAVAAWGSRPRQRHALGNSRVALPVAFTVTAFALVTYEAFVALDPLAVALIRLTLGAVVLRLGFTLWWLSRKRAELEALAASDPLTGLGNYRAFQEQLAAAVADGGAAGVIVLDLDHFKALNDTFGHAEGDRVLQVAATALAQTVGEAGFVARIGGEEFAILAHGLDAQAAAGIAERCRAALARLVVPGPTLACSAGVAAFPTHASTVPQLLQATDGALYWAKRSGRNRTRVYDPRHVVALSLPEQRLEVQALLASKAPVTAVFQPMMEVATGRVAGYEALARFAAPFERPPHLWFAQAHRCGLGAVLEACALRAALAVADRPRGTFLALNVSPAALLAPEVGAALPHDLDGIVIELTEHEAFDEDGALELALTALRARGARIALDDAGAGYAGLQQLIRIRPDIVKVDRSLVAGIHEDGSKLALLEALAHFATTTGAAVCAEGVEELSELRALAGVDVTYAQGYALARPGPAWPVIPPAVAAEVASADHHGMRLSRIAVDGAASTLAEMTDVLAQARTLEALNRALQGVMLQLGAQDACMSRVDGAAACVVTVSSHDWVATGERFRLADYPTTAHVVVEQVIGQVIAGDPAGDPAELEVLAIAGMKAVLLMPLVHDGATIALLEIYRRSPQAWTNTQVDLARVLANHIAACLARVTARARPAPSRGQPAPR
jgi:diguanylate cyclase (GGDEF)-like protein